MNVKIEQDGIEYEFVRLGNSAANEERVLAQNRLVPLSGSGTKLWAIFRPKVKRHRFPASGYPAVIFEETEFREPRSPEWVLHMDAPVYFAGSNHSQRRILRPVAVELE